MGNGLPIVEVVGEFDGQGCQSTTATTLKLTTAGVVNLGEKKMGFEKPEPVQTSEPPRSFRLEQDPDGTGASSGPPPLPNGDAVPPDTATLEQKVKYIYNSNRLDGVHVPYEQTLELLSAPVSICRTRSWASSRERSLCSVTRRRWPAGSSLTGTPER